ncbi:hypothetical protein [Streptomyces sp. NPDC003996]
MTEPLSLEREQEIRESIPTVYGPPWTLEPDMVDGTWRVMYATDHPLAGLVAVVPDYGAHLAEFIATARAAVPELLGEIQRLRAELANRPQAGPLVVSRYDVVMEPAPEEEPVLTVGAVAEGGRPVALLFDEETRRRVAGWLAPDVAQRLARASSFDIPWPGHSRPLLLQRSYAGGDRWWSGDRDGCRWHREDGFVSERQGDERTRTDTRFPFAEAWPLAHQIAAGEAGT